jgi:hypothetical protein
MRFEGSASSDDQAAAIEFDPVGGYYVYPAATGFFTNQGASRIAMESIQTHHSLPLGKSGLCWRHT